jgi:hypothetical protein
MKESTRNWVQSHRTGLAIAFVVGVIAGLPVG